MKLSEFPDGTMPFETWGHKMDVAQFKQFWMDGLVMSHDARPDFAVSVFWLTPKGAASLNKTAIDPKRLPYQRGVQAKLAGVSRDWHDIHAKHPDNRGGLAPGSDCHRQWLAGWDATTLPRSKR